MRCCRRSRCEEIREGGAGGVIQNRRHFANSLALHREIRLDQPSPRPPICSATKSDACSKEGLGISTPREFKSGTPTGQALEQKATASLIIWSSSHAAIYRRGGKVLPGASATGSVRQKSFREHAPKTSALGLLALGWKIEGAPRGGATCAPRVQKRRP